MIWYTHSIGVIMNCFYFPNNIYVAIFDEDGITIESRVGDPFWKCSYQELMYLWNKTEKEVDEHFLMKLKYKLDNIQ